MNSLKQRLVTGLTALLVASALWLPCAHWIFQGKPARAQSGTNISTTVRELAARHDALWTPEGRNEVARMRRTNPEWDFMGRSFVAWSMAELAVREPEHKADYLRVMDTIIADTLAAERKEGMYYFMMPYARASAFRQKPDRSQFIDGEIALMLALRRFVEEKPEYKPLLTERVNQMAARMRASPVLCTESYPDECWLFCNTVSLAAIRIADRLDGSDHEALFRDWVTVAKQKLVEPKTGLLISSFTWDGQPKDGPEGSSIWMAAHCLRLIDEEFARDQYTRARKELGRSIFGFAYSREWPESWVGPADVDSGGVVPILNASAGGSGMAFIAAGSFEDKEYFNSLFSTLDMAAFPLRKSGQLKYCASNQVGDAVLLYSCVLGPIWRKILEPKPKAL